jgi:ubiquinol-cytochrome c reductase iron-sulfur subunit
VIRRLLARRRRARPAPSPEVVPPIDERLHGGVEGIDEGGPDEGHVFAREEVAGRRAETVTLLLLGLTVLCAVAFIVILLALPHHTQLLGATMGGALAAMGAALAYASKRVVPQEQAIEERPRLAHPEALPPVRRTLRTTGRGVSRRRLLLGAGAAAGTTLAAAVAAPVTALGPSVGDSIVDTPWRRGRRLVDEQGRPITAEDVSPGSFVTAYPEGADRRELGSPVVVVRDDPARLRLPPARRTWAPEGLLAFSKICTHAGCAVALYRSPLYQPTSQPPGLACPCHYSVFDTRDGGSVVAGPAGRPLPQLPLTIDPATRELRAGGGFSGPIGPSWWGARG